MDDAENPVHPAAAAAAADDLAEEPEPDYASELRSVCIGACLGCTIVAVSGVLLYLFRRSADMTTAIGVLAGVGLVVGILELILGMCFCATAVCFCIHGDISGKPQDELPLVQP